MIWLLLLAGGALLVAKSRDGAAVPSGPESGFDEPTHEPVERVVTSARPSSRTVEAAEALAERVADATTLRAPPQAASIAGSRSSSAQAAPAESQIKPEMRSPGTIAVQKQVTSSARALAKEEPGAAATAAPRVTIPPPAPARSVVAPLRQPPAVVVPPATRTAKQAAASREEPRSSAKQAGAK